MDEENRRIAAAAQAYATSHEVGPLFEELTKSLLVEKPREPLEHLASAVERLREPGSKWPLAAGACGTEEASEAYMTEHRLPQTLEEIMGKLLFEKPDDLHTWLATEFRRLARERTPTFFGDDDLRGMFSLFDPTGRGRISEVQVRTALRNLGLQDAEEGEGKDEADGGAAAGEADSEPTVSLEDFVERATAAVRRQRIV